MKKSRFIVSLCSLALLCGATFTSCGSDDGSLSKGDAKSALKDIVLMQDSASCTSFYTGYYEVDRDAYMLLNKLKNAEMVTVTFDTKYHDVQVGYWSNRHIKQEKHVFAKVDFTEKGKKYIITNVPKLRKDIKEIQEKLVKEIDVKEPKYLTVDQKTIDYYDIDAKTGKNNNPEEEIVAVDSVEYFESDSGNYKDEYEKAYAKVHTESFDVLLGKGKIDKVYEVYCPEEYKKVGKGECKFLFKVDDFTPFGWCIYDIKEGQCFNYKAELKHYEDKGWVVEDFEPIEN